MFDSEVVLINVVLCAVLQKKYHPGHPHVALWRTHDGWGDVNGYTLGINHWVSLVLTLKILLDPSLSDMSEGQQSFQWFAGGHTSA